MKNQQFNQPRDLALHLRRMAYLNRKNTKDVAWVFKTNSDALPDDFAARRQANDVSLWLLDAQNVLVTWFCPDAWKLERHKGDTTQLDSGFVSDRFLHPFSLTSGYVHERLATLDKDLSNIWIQYPNLDQATRMMLAEYKVVMDFLHGLYMDAIFGKAINWTTLEVK